MAGALESNVNLASGLSALLTTLLGKEGGTETTSYGGSTTKQTLVNPQDIMKQLLEGAGTVGYGKAGLAANLGAEKRAGLYNSRSGSLNINDLMSRVATEASIAGAPTVTTNPTITKSGVNSQAGLMSGNNAGLGLLALLAGSKSGRKKMGDLYDEYFGADVMVGTPQGDIPTELQGISPGDYNFDTSSAMVSSVDTNTSSKSDSTTSMDGFGAAAGTLDYANMIGDQGGDAIGALMTTNASNWGIDIAPDMVDQFSDFGAGSAADSVGGGLDLGGFPVVSAISRLSDGEISRGDVGAVAGGWGGAEAGAAMGTAIFPGVGTAIGGILGGLLGSSAGGGCFITTAILQALGDSDDNARELQILRQYRDTWLRTNHPEDIEEYYRIAPSVVEAINDRSDSGQVWRNLWRGFLSPAIHLVVQGKNEEAYNVYRAMVEVATAWATTPTSNFEKEVA